MKTHRLVPIAAGLAVAFGAASPASAEVYATSFFNATNLFVNIIPPTNVTSPLPLTSSDKSASSAQLNGTAPVATGGVGTDAAVAFGTGGTIAVPTNNAFTPVGMTGVDSYSYADSYIPNRQTGGQAYTTVLGLGETLLNDAGVSGTTNTENSSSTSVSLKLDDVGNGTQIFFTFAALPFLQAVIANEPLIPRDATAGVSVKVALTRLNTNGTSTQVFQWLPNGVTDANISGGVELQDGVDLNTSATTGFNNTTALHDPTGLGIQADISSSYTPGNAGVVPVWDATNKRFYSADTYPTSWGLFGAGTNSLAAGDYSLKIEAFTTTNALRTPQREVPEPGTLALLGMGLAGLAGVTLKRRQTT
jgi:hypothetical protein